MATCGSHRKMTDFQMPHRLDKTIVPEGFQECTASIPNLAGQGTVIDEAISRFQTGVSRMIQLSGLPLIGKSFVAQKVAADLSRNSFDWFGCIQLPIHTIGLREHVERGMRDMQSIRQCILDALLCTEPGIATNPDRFLRFLRQCRSPVRMFIFENAEVLTDNTHLQDEFLDLCISICHASTKFLLIITTRQQFSFVREESLFYSIEVHPLSTEDSRCLFRSIAGDIGLWEQQLVSPCSGIPHLLLIVARCLRDHLYTPDEMFTAYKTTGLYAFAESHTPETTDLYTELDTCVQKLTGFCLKRRCVDLAYIPGTFSPEAAAYVTGLPVAIAKHDLIDPVHSLSLISQDGSRGNIDNDPGSEPQYHQRFQIHAFVRSLIEDRYGLLRDESLIRNRYCHFFAKLLQRLAPLADRSRGREFRLITQELTNLEKLLQQAVHLVDEHYELFFDIAYNGEYHIINLMPKKESVDFYEALMNTAKLKDRQQYGILLSAFGQVLNFAQTRYSKAYDQYMASLEYLLPFGDSHDLAWLYSHIGYYWFELGHYNEAASYGVTAYYMIQRVNAQISEEKKRYAEREVPIPQGLVQKDFMTDKITGSIQSTLGLVYGEMGRTDEAIQYHHECIDLRWIIYGFHPTLGSCYNNLSEAYEKKGDLRKALEQARIGMNIKKHFMKDPSNAVIESLIAMARLTRRTDGDTQYALRLLREAYEMRRVLGVPHVQALCILYETGRIRYHREEYQKAVEAFQGAISMHHKMESPRRQKAETLRMLGMALWGAEQLQSSANILAESLEEQEKIPEAERMEEDIIKAVATRRELARVRKILTESK